MAPLRIDRGRGSHRRRFAVLAAATLALLAIPAAVTPSALVAGVAVAAEVADRLEIVTSKGTFPFAVELVDREETRAKGLMFRTEMAADHGMLFDFKREQPVWFWMKNTYLPLDMIFVRADGTVRAVAADTTPLSEATIPSDGPVRFVLEVDAGTAARIGLRPGDRLVHPLMHAAP